MGNSRLCVNFTFKITAMFTASDSKYLSDNQWYMPYNELLAAFNWEIIGYSSEERPILNTTLGSGSRSVCMWAGMHGNETTGVFMLLSLIDLYTRKKIDLSAFSIHIIPVINPDAYVRFTRRNGLSIDLNRDFRAFQTIESAKLIGWIKMKSPELCLNLHDQRSIFHVNNDKLGPIHCWSPRRWPCRMFGTAVLAPRSSQASGGETQCAGWLRGPLRCCYRQSVGFPHSLPLLTT